MKGSAAQNAMISIIVPVYNSEKYLGKSIESIINQSYNNIELILVNDGSTDDSGKICSRYALADNRVKVITRQNNGGPAAARNNGIQHAKGNFIFFIDADDFLEKNAIELFAANHNEHQTDLVAGNFNRIINHNAPIKQNVSFSFDYEPFRQDFKVLSKAEIIDYIRYYLKSPGKYLLFAFCWGKLYKTAIIKSNCILFNEEMQFGEDVVFNFEYLKCTNEILFVNQALYNYTVQNNYNSASMSISDNLFHNLNMIRIKASEFLELSGTMSPSGIRKETGHAFVHLIIVHLVRICGQITHDNRKRIYNLIKKIVNNSVFKDSLQVYSPSKGNSKILTLLMKFRLVSLFMLVSRRIAHKRYGKRGT